jgi:hypothetical protein
MNYRMASFGSAKPNTLEFAEPTFYFPDLQINHRQWEVHKDCHLVKKNHTPITSNTTHVQDIRGASKFIPAES